jgi:hypothetical protein
MPAEISRRLDARHIMKENTKRVLSRPTKVFSLTDYLGNARDAILDADRMRHRKHINR